MRVIVTGASTPLGAAVIAELLGDRNVDRIVAIAREPVATHADRRVECRQLDLTRRRVIRDLLWDARSLGIDCVIDGMQHRDIGDRGPTVHAQNVHATQELVLGCVDHPTIKRFVYRSFGELYMESLATTQLVDEDAPLDIARGMSQWLRDRFEAELVVCAQLATSLSIAVLRCAEVFAAGTGSQLWDYVQSRVCLRPLGFDPMVNVLSLDDAARALVLAARSDARGVFNIPGRDTLPLSILLQRCRRMDIPVPGPLLAPLYALRRITGRDFRYKANARQLHLGCVLDGTRAREQLGYTPGTSVRWPVPWLPLLLERLAERDRAA